MRHLYLAETRKGRLLKIVEDVALPSQSEKLSAMGYGNGHPMTAPALIARFVNEQDAEMFLRAYNEYCKAHKI